MCKQYDRVIVDGNNILFRAFYTKRPDKIVNNVNVTPIYHFLNILKSLTKKFKPSEILMTWDKKLNSTKKNFRKDLVPYKEHRVEKDRTELFNTIDHIQKFIDVLGIHTVYPVNMEADDVIRFLSIQEPDKSTIIISSDKDLLQLINERVDLYLPSKEIIVNVDNFVEHANVDKDLFILYKSIVGDVSDNIAGLDNFGIVRSKALAEKINQSSIDEVNLTEEQKKIIKNNMVVVDLQQTEIMCSDEYSFYIDQLNNSNQCFDASKLRQLFNDYALNNFLTSFGEWNNLFNNNKDDSDLLSHLSM